MLRRQSGMFTWCRTLTPTMASKLRPSRPSPVSTLPTTISARSPTRSRQRAASSSLSSTAVSSQPRLDEPARELARAAAELEAARAGSEPRALDQEARAAVGPDLAGGARPAPVVLEVVADVLAALLPLGGVPFFPRCGREAILHRADASFRPCSPARDESRRRAPCPGSGVAPAPARPAALPLLVRPDRGAALGRRRVDGRARQRDQPLQGAFPGGRHDRRRADAVGGTGRRRRGASLRRRLGREPRPDRRLPPSPEPASLPRRRDARARAGRAGRDPGPVLLAGLVPGVSPPPPRANRARRRRVRRRRANSVFADGLEPGARDARLLP